MINTIMIDSQNLVVILGCQRSGTTLLGQILGSHGKTFLIDEFDGLYKWFDAWNKQLSSSKKLFNSTIKKASKKYTDERSNFRSFDDLRCYKIVLKAPNLTFSYAELAVMNPKPTTLFVVRDVKAVVASMLKLPHIIHRQIDFFQKNQFISKKYHEELLLLNNNRVQNHIKAAIIWKVKNKLYDKFCEKGLVPLLVKYEQLVDVNKMQFEQLIRHCGLEFSTSLTNHHQLMAGEAPGNTSRSRKIDKSSLSKWKKDLTEKEIADVNWFESIN